ncbi:13500_t:CDS:2, partial [Entrophospora sp. SA101]
EQMNYEGVVKIWTGIKRDGGGITFYELYSKNLERTRRKCTKSTRSKNKLKVQETDDHEQQLRVIKKYKMLENDNLRKLAFNNPFLSCVIDLDCISKLLVNIFSREELECMNICEKMRSWKTIENVLKLWIKQLSELGQSTSYPDIPSNLSEEKKEVFLYILEMFKKLSFDYHWQSIWKIRRYDNKLNGDSEILENTFIHEIMHDIIYETVQKDTKMCDEGNENIRFDYDLWILNMSDKEKKACRNKFKSKLKPDWISSFLINETKFEFIYGEATGPPFLQDQIKIEQDRRKLIRYLRKCNKSVKSKLNMHMSLVVDDNLINKIKSIPRFGMLLHGTSLKILYYNSNYEVGHVMQLFDVLIPLSSYSESQSVCNYLYGLIIFRNAVLDSVREFEEFEDVLKYRNVFENTLQVDISDDDDLIYPSPKKQRGYLTDSSNK